jgi:hypothetical protein
MQQIAREEQITLPPLEGDLSSRNMVAGDLSGLGGKSAS